jgi:hypothetical protein
MMWTRLDGSDQQGSSGRRRRQQPSGQGGKTHAGRVTRQQAQMTHVCRRQAAMLAGAGCLKVATVGQPATYSHDGGNNCCWWGLLLLTHVTGGVHRSRRTRV